jgi:hypothetical protein
MQQRFLEACIGYPVYFQKSGGLISKLIGEQSLQDGVNRRSVKCRLVSVIQPVPLKSLKVTRN